jgi:hypothetical protein
MIMTTSSRESTQLAVIEALVGLSTVDLPCGDLYLHRAETLLERSLTKEKYLVLRGDRESLPSVAKALHQAAERSDWQRVRALAEEGLRDRQRLADNERILSFGDAVYGPRVLHADAAALALSGVVVQATSHLGRVRDDGVARLRFALAHDDEQADLYRARLAHLESLEIVPDETAGTVVNAANLQQRILEAADREDFGEAERLSAAIINAAPGNRPGRLRAPRPAAGRIQVLAAELPHAAIGRARDLGLSAVELPADGALNGYLSCCCVERVTFPDAPLTECHRRPETCTCGHICPPEVSDNLRGVLDLLILHPFVTSAGARYLPWFGGETILVETFPETEPDTRTGLIDLLRLPRRCGLSRFAIEDATRSYTAELCSTLGLGAAEYSVVPIPFDAYLRLAPRFGWGRDHRWTHFDGYQLTRELHLRALVGGDVEYGGPEDLCSVARNYEADRIGARFAIVRRQRFTAREPERGG